MSVLMFIVGAVALMAGVGMIGFGIPINEFSFGNTLIVAGTSAAAGGLVMIGLAAVVAQLQRIAEGLAMWTPTRPGRMAETLEAPGVPRAVPAAGPRAPFPPKIPAKPKLETKPDFPPRPSAEPVLAATRPVEAPAVAAAVLNESAREDRVSVSPSLPNPDVPPVEIGEEVSLSPGEPQSGPAPAAEVAEPVRATPPRPRFGFGGFGVNPRRQDAAPDPAWSPPPPPPTEVTSPQEPEEAAKSSHFDDMWPAFEPKSSRTPPVLEEDKPDAMPEPAPLQAEKDPADEPVPSEVQPQPADTQPDEPVRAVAILKSGVVDGMGYTLYVDGSIEAELPQGTLRFSSINDLRNYLEKTS